MNGYWISALIILAVCCAWWLGYLVGYYHARVKTAAHLYDLLDYAPEIEPIVTKFMATHPWRDA